MGNLAGDPNQYFYPGDRHEHPAWDSHEKNGMSYTLHGDYYLPDLVLNEAEPTYGMLRKQFLKEHRSARYQYLLLTGKLNEHLNQTDQEAREQVEMLMKQMAEKRV